MINSSLNSENILNRKQIIFYPLGQFEESFLEELVHEVSVEFSCHSLVQELKLDPELYYDPTRRQYNGNIILKEIDQIPVGNDVKKIGLLQVDLFIPILTFIFGQAIFKGNTGIASLFRLRNEQYGLQSDYQLLIIRFKKVIFHELGHTFGLIHCQVPTCVMRSSTYVEDLDQKSLHFCAHCKEELERFKE